MLSDDKISRLDDDELIAKALMVLSHSKAYGLSASEIDLFYSLGEGQCHLNDSPYNQEELARAKEILVIASTIILHQKKHAPSSPFPMKDFWLVIFAAEHIYDTDQEIVDYKKFFNSLYDIDRSLVTNSQNEHSKARMAKMKAGEDPDDIKVNSYYFKWTGLPHQVASRDNRKKKIVSEMKDSANRKKLTLRRKAGIMSTAA